MADFIFERYNYWAIMLLMMVGLYVTFQAGNLIKRLVGLTVFQTSVFLFYITLSKISGGTAPILFGRDYPREYGGYGEEGAAEVPQGPGFDQFGRPHVDSYLDPSGIIGGEPLYEVYSNPLPHVLILTAIVVGVATLAVGLALVVRIRESYGTIEMDEVREAEMEHAKTESPAESA